MCLNNNKATRSLIYIGIIFLIFTKCSMNSADIRKGEYLDRAKETSVEDFFQKRMQNRIKKVLGANWEILFESNDFIYFGYPLISFFREGTFLEEFFKVKKAEIELDFPSYKNFDGISMKKICYETINELKKTEWSKVHPRVECVPKLEKNHIVILVNYTYKIEKNQYNSEKYLLQLDKVNLKKENITKLE